MKIIDEELLATQSVHALIIKLKDGRQAEVTVTYNYDEASGWENFEAEISNEGIFSWTEQEEIREFAKASYRNR